LELTQVHAVAATLSAGQEQDLLLKIRCQL
jgi:hypothetical protein